MGRPHNKEPGPGLNRSALDDSGPQAQGRIAGVLPLCGEELAVQRVQDRRYGHGESDHRRADGGEVSFS